MSEYDYDYDWDVMDSAEAYRDWAEQRELAEAEADRYYERWLSSLPAQERDKELGR